MSVNRVCLHAIQGFKEMKLGIYPFIESVDLLYGLFRIAFVVQSRTLNRLKSRYILH